MDIMGNRWINLSSSYMAIVTGLQGSSKGSGLGCAKIMIRIYRVQLHRALVSVPDLLVLELQPRASGLVGYLVVAELTVIGNYIKTTHIRNHVL